MNSNNAPRNNTSKEDKMQSKYKFENVKNDYFLQKLFGNLKRKRTLAIIKYNKNIKNRINVSINDYKVYFNACHQQIWQ